MSDVNVIWVSIEKKTTERCDVALPDHADQEKD